MLKFIVKTNNKLLDNDKVKTHEFNVCEELKDHYQKGGKLVVEIKANEDNEVAECLVSKG